MGRRGKKTPKLLVFPLQLERSFLFVNVFPVSLKTKLFGRIMFPESSEHPLKHI